MFLSITHTTKDLFKTLCVLNFRIIKPFCSIIMQGFNIFSSPFLVSGILIIIKIVGRTDLYALYISRIQGICFRFVVSFKFVKNNSLENIGQTDLYASYISRILGIYFRFVVSFKFVKKTLLENIQSFSKLGMQLFWPVPWS